LRQILGHDDAATADAATADAATDAAATDDAEVCTTDTPLACWEDGTADGVLMKSTESDATEDGFMAGKGFTCGRTMEGLP